MAARKSVRVPVKATQSIWCNVHVDTWNFSGGDFWLPRNQEYELTIDYPVSNPFRAKIRTGKNGLGFAGLMTKIVKAYQRMYDQEDRDMRRKGDDCAGRWGIWGHDIGDLAISGVRINHNKRTISLYVSS